MEAVIATLQFQIALISHELDGSDIIGDNTELNEIEFAIDLLIFEEINHPGKGYTFFEQDIAPPHVLPINIPYLDFLMNCPSKCIKMLGWTPKEVLHLLTFMELEIEAEGAINGNGFYRRC